MANTTILLDRRSFSTWLAASGFALTTGRCTVANDFDETKSSPPTVEPVTSNAGIPSGSNAFERWTAAENESWRWYERESLVQGHWRLTGITTPVNRATGERLDHVPGYLDESLVPIESRRVDSRIQEGPPVVLRNQVPLGTESYGQVSLERRAQDGRPPSEWLRSLEVEELREWLSKVEVTEADVMGMTFWTHLTRDHFFRPLLIKGLTEVEQAKLHAAAHFGY